jgi:glycosyltransferase involved in cell wall biosynthesis
VKIPAGYEDTPELRAHLAKLAAWRALSWDEQLDRIGAAPADREPEPDGGRYRVGFWMPCLVYGGAETWQIALARELDPRIFALQGACIVGGMGFAQNPQVEALRRSMPVSAGRKAAAELASRCEILVSWCGTDPAPLFEELKRRPRFVWVAHCPAAGYAGQVPIPEGSVDRYAAVSELALDAIPEGRRASSRVIWNAVDPGRLEPRRPRAEVRASWGIPGDAPVAGYLGRLSHEKGAAAMARLARELPEPWRVVVVGEGHQRAELQREAEVNPRLRVVGPDPHPGDSLAAFDALCVPSRYESFGLTIAEGLWSGLPVVSTDCGLARLRPGLTYPIPFEPSGPDFARAVLDAFASGPRPGALDFAREQLAPARFAREWGSFLASIGGAARKARLDACPHRGPVLPLSMQPSCGCASKELSECRAGKGAAPGRVTLRDCLACVG